MPKFMIAGRYNATGIQGLRKDKASGREKAVGASGLMTVRTVPLLSVAEMDQALGETTSYRPPGG